MRTFLLLVFACAVVTASRKPDNVNTLLLKECIDTTKYIKDNSPNGVHQRFVMNVFKNQPCSEESPCRVAAALKHEPHDTELGMLQRQLSAYAVHTGHQKCTVANTEESSMMELLDNLLGCCRKLISRQKKHH